MNTSISHRHTNVVDGQRFKIRAGWAISIATVYTMCAGLHFPEEKNMKERGGGKHKKVEINGI